MKAIVFEEKEKVEIWDDLEPPKIEKKNEILTRTVFTGVSVGTERHLLKGGPYSNIYGGFPIIPGYQYVGKVERLGSEVSNLNVGDYIVSDYSKPPSNYSIKGLKYQNWMPMGHMEIHVAPIERVIKLPPNADLKEYALLPVASIGFHICKRGRVASGEKVLVIGLGIIGQLCAQIARARGAKVVGCDIDMWRLEMAKRYSCDEVFNPSTNINSNLKDLGPFDVVIETSGAENIMDLCLEAIKRDGRIVPVAGRFTITYDNLKAQLLQAEIIHTDHFEMQDAIATMQLCRTGKVEIKPLITHQIKLCDAPDFYRWILKSQEKLLGVVIDWQSR